eukprot:1520857-Prymnesium_polylepis.1
MLPVKATDDDALKLKGIPSGAALEVAHVKSSPMSLHVGELYISGDGGVGGHRVHWQDGSLCRGCHNAGTHERRRSRIVASSFVHPPHGSPPGGRGDAARVLSDSSEDGCGGMYWGADELQRRVSLLSDLHGIETTQVVENMYYMSSFGRYYWSGSKTGLLPN